MDYTNQEKFELEQKQADLEVAEMKLKRTRIGCWILAGASLIAAIYCGKKLKDVLGVVNSAVTDVSNLTYIDVQEAVVNKAVNEAVRKAANKAAKDSAGAIREMVGVAVTNVVQNSKHTVKSAVAKKVAAEIAEINGEDLTREIIAEAKEMIADKFEGKLDGIAADFSKNLENVGKIYQNIADTMKKSAEG